MRRIPARPLIISIIAAAALIGIVVALPGIHTRQVHEQAVYYCPMHPTYTSSKPGSCPICNMTLVKREPQDRPQTTDHRPQQAKDICYMHNCPKAHGGKPCPMMVVAKAGERVICPICGSHIAEAAMTPTAAHPAAAGAQRILYWTDPMLPGYKSDKPGKSPMGMDLVPVYEGEGETAASSQATAPSGYTPVLVTPQKQQLIGVKTAPAARRVITKTIRTVGQIAYDPELYQAEQEYLQGLKAFQRAQGGTIPEVTEQAKQLVDSSRMRLQLLGLSQEFIQEMATWSGPDQSLLLADLSGHVWVYAPIYEFELPFVKAGQTIAIEIPAMPGRVLEGIIRSVDPILDATTRSARARAILTDPEHALKPGMFINASIHISTGEVLAIPEEAVFNTGTKQIIFVDKGQGLFEPRDVAVGIKADGSYEIKSGIAEGEMVVTSGNFLIDSESRLKAALEGMGGDGGHQHGQ